MKSVVELCIDVPQSRAADLYMDPNNNPKWMDEIDRIHFPGLLGRIIGVVAAPAIKRPHRRHMESFKRFAERHA